MRKIALAAACAGLFTTPAMAQDPVTVDVPASSAAARPLPVTAEEIARQQAEAQAAQVVAANREIFANLDADGNGMLSPDEFLRLAAAPQPVDAAPTMQRLDLNRDGSVTLVEHRTIMLSTFDAIDADKDGVVTPAESEAASQAQAQAAANGR